MSYNTCKLPAQVSRFDFQFNRKTWPGNSLRYALSYYKVCLGFPNVNINK